MEALTLKGFSKVYQLDKELILAHKWSNYLIYIMPFILGIYLGICMVYIVPPIFALTGIQMMMISMGGIIIFSIPLLYLGLSGLINTIFFTFNTQGIRIDNKPIPWFLLPNRFIPKNKIKRIFVKEVIHKKVPIYQVIVELHTGKEIIIQSYGLYFGEKAAYYANDTANLILKYF